MSHQYEMFRQRDEHEDAPSERGAVVPGVSKLYAYVRNTSTKETFDDLSLYFPDGTRMKIKRLEIRTPIPRSGRQASVKGSPPQWQDLLSSVENTIFLENQLVGSVLPQHELKIQIGLENIQPYEKLDPFYAAQFDEPLNDEAILGYSDSEGRCWRKHSNESASSYPKRNLVPQDQLTRRQRQANAE